MMLGLGLYVEFKGLWDSMESHLPMTKIALNILYIVVCLYQSQSSNLSVTSPPGNHKIVFYICDCFCFANKFIFIIF